MAEDTNIQLLESDLEQTGKTMEGVLVCAGTGNDNRTHHVAEVQPCTEQGT